MGTRIVLNWIGWSTANSAEGEKFFGIAGSWTDHFKS